MTLMRPATLDEVGLMLDWAAEEGWNPGLDDAAAFYAADPEGFFVATQDGTPVAAISVVNHSDSFAFLGLYLARPQVRGRGIGFALWQHAMAHAGDRTVGLDGVPDQQANYAKSGFQHAGKTTRYQGTIAALSNDDMTLATGADLPRLTALEAEASGTLKPQYLTAWLTQTARRKTIMLGDTAFCTVRQCRAGAKIGPLFSDTAETARALLHHAATLCPGPVSIDVPKASTGLVDLCTQLGLVPGFETARMYRGTPARGRAEVFAVTSLELG